MARRTFDFEQSEQNYLIDEAELIASHGVLKTIRLNKIIQKTPAQFRANIDPNEFEDQLLIQNIKDIGVISPITVRENDPRGREYILLSGDRRVQASRLAGNTDIPALVYGYDEEGEYEWTDFRINFSENRFRKSLNPYESFKNIVYGLEINKLNQNLSLQKFAEDQGISYKQVQLISVLMKSNQDYGNNDASLYFLDSLIEFWEINPDIALNTIYLIRSLLNLIDDPVSEGFVTENELLSSFQILSKKAKSELEDMIKRFKGLMGVYPDSSERQSLYQFIHQIQFISPVSKIETKVVTKKVNSEKPKITSSIPSQESKKDAISKPAIKKQDTQPTKPVEKETVLMAGGRQLEGDDINEYGDLDTASKKLFILLDPIFPEFSNHQLIQFSYTLYLSVIEESNLKINEFISWLSNTIFLLNTESNSLKNNLNAILSQIQK